MRGLKKVGAELRLRVLSYNFKRTINIVGVKKMIEAVTCQVTNILLSSNLPSSFSQKSNTSSRSASRAPAADHVQLNLVFRRSDEFMAQGYVEGLMYTASNISLTAFRESDSKFALSSH